MRNLQFRRVLKRSLAVVPALFAVICFSSCGDSDHDHEHGSDFEEGVKSSPEWNSSMNGVWTTDLYNVPETDLLSMSGKSPREASIEKLSKSEFPIDKSEIVTFVNNGKTYLRFPLEEGEQIYGLGLNFKTVQQRGRIMRLHTDHYGGEDNGRTHAPVPFFVSTEGYGVLINSASYIDVNVGVGVTKDSRHPAKVKDRNAKDGWSSRPYSDNLEIVVPEEGVELILFSGDDLMEVVQRFNLYCGGGFIPPKWGLGFWHRTPTLYSDKDVLKEIEGFKAKNFPLDVVGLEPGWHSKAYPCTFEWDSDRFPDPAKFNRDVMDKSLKVNLWANPYLWPGSDIDKKMAAYTGSHTVWNGTVPDYTIKEAREVMKSHIKEHQLDLGVSGYKMDEVDGYDFWVWPDNATYPSGHTGEQMRQLYGNLVMKLTDEAFREKNERTYGLVRAANAGSVNYPYVIYNDYYSHKDFINALITSSFNGVLWTPEVRASGSAEEWVRRMQTVCFSPLAMINAWADGTKPWSFPEVYKECQDAAFLRMQLLPYLYSTFSQYYFEGKPPFRAMNMAEGFYAEEEITEGELDGTANPYAEAKKREIRDQYMTGDNILVAPVYTGETERKVVLPKGRWFDFYSGEFAGESEVITVKATLDRIPVFVKDGGIIPMISKIRQTSEWGNNMPLEVRVYGSADGEFNLYDDDGKSFDYESGKYTIKTLRYRDGIGSVVDVESNSTWSYGDITWREM